MTACKTNRCVQGHKPCPTHQACGMHQHNSDGIHAYDSIFTQPWQCLQDLIHEAVCAVFPVATFIVLAGLAGYFWGFL